MRRGARIVAGIGLGLTLPRILVSWFVLDRTPVPAIATLLFVLGVLVVGLVLNQRLLARLGSRWWTALVGIGAVVVGAIATTGVTALSSAVAVSGYHGVVAPPQVALVNWLFLAAVAVWLLGVVLLLSAAFGGLIALLSGSRRPR
jgi:hypothetical protein